MKFRFLLFLPLLAFFFFRFEEQYAHSRSLTRSQYHDIASDSRVISCHAKENESNESRYKETKKYDDSKTAQFHSKNQLSDSRRNNSEILPFIESKTRNKIQASSSKQINIKSNQFPIVAPNFLRATKGAFPDKILVSWQAPGEFYEGFESGFPPEWQEIKEDTLPAMWVISQFLPAEGKYCIKYDVYSPGIPLTSYLLTPKFFIPHDKTTLRLKIKTAYAAFNTYNSEVLISTENDSLSSFQTIKTLTAAYLKTLTQWQTLDIDLSNYADKFVYLAFKGYAEDLIIYIDDIKLVGVEGLNYVARNVKNYTLFVYPPDTFFDLTVDTTFYEFEAPNFIEFGFSVRANYTNDSISNDSNYDWGIAYSQNDSLVIEEISNITPTIDGQINYSEYEDALKVPLTKFGFWAKAYLKLSNDKLFIAVDYFKDFNKEPYDFMLFAFDKNRNKQYEENSEGYYRILLLPDEQTEKSFFPWSPLGFTQGILNPAGFEGKIGDLPPYFGIHYEMSIDLSASNLSIPQNGIIGAYFYVFNAKNEQKPSWLEKVSSEYFVKNFGSITLKPYVVSVDKEKNYPANYSLEQNYPNPFNPSTTIKYSLPEESFVTLKIYDPLGKCVKTLVNGRQTAGYYEIKVDASDLTSGVYFYELKANSYRSIKKMILTK